MKKNDDTKDVVSEFEEIAAEIKADEKQAVAEGEATEKAEATEEAEATGEEEATEEAEATEEVKATEEPEATEEKCGMKLWKKVMIIAGGVLLLLLAAYFGVAKYYSQRFVMNTTVNGVACAGKTVEDVEAMMQTRVEEYVLTLEEAGGTTGQIKGVDIGIKYNGIDVIQEAFAEQNPYTWFTGLYQKNNIEAVVDFEYDSAKLDEAISQLDCLKAENQVAPVAAKPIYADGTYEIQEEVYGTQIHSENLYAVIQASVAAMDTTVNLEEKQCYVLPAYTKDSQEVIGAKDALNTCLKANITYSLDSVTVNVDIDKIVPWLSVDESMNVIVDEAQVRAFTDTLSATYNTPNGSADLTTPTGKVVNLSNARRGRVVGSAAECAQLIEEIRAGKTVTREPILSQQATPEGQTVWGTTYIEVDISEQHMWYISDGAVAFESDVVTGAPGLDTPAGIFTILEKLSPKTLRGNIVPATGKPEYITPVKYWARVTWSGIGFHDATWQAAFGGNRYREGYGSHGCINMPYDAIAQFYGMISVGCPVIIHY